MNKKSILAWLVWITIFSLLFWYSLVFAWTWIFEIAPKIMFKVSENVYLDSLQLKNTQILFKSAKDLEKFTIKSECNIFSKLVSSNWEYYLFDLKFFDNKCNDNNFALLDENSETTLKFTLNIVKNYDIFSKLYDIETPRLIQLKNILDDKISLYSKYEKYDNTVIENYYIYLEKNRILNEAIYNQAIINNIIEKRKEKYLVPVAWHVMPTLPSKVPNSSRLYRSDYTDWIHHGWDIDWYLWEQVIALQEWIIVRVVDKFEFSDLNMIKNGSNLTIDDKIKNLDILRWKQVWLKTLSWDVIMYSHLNDIYTNIKAWEIVKKWQPLWVIWKTGVPDINYTDYHLHYEVCKNPFITEKVWLYDFDDYMRWDWAFKWATIDYIVENQWKYFE